MMMKKMKRKDLELDEFSDDFSDFSLSSPARKIRRLVFFFSLSVFLTFLLFYLLPSKANPCLFLILFWLWRMLSCRQ